MLSSGEAWGYLFLSIVGVKITSSLRDIWNYSKEIHRRALEEIRLKPSAAIIKFIAALVALGVLYWIFGQEAALQQLVYGAALTVLAVLFTYLWSLVEASALLHKVQVERIKELEQKNGAVNEPGLQISYQNGSAPYFEEIHHHGPTNIEYSFRIAISTVRTVNAVSGVSVALTEFSETFGHLHRPFSFQHYPTWNSLTCNSGDTVPVDILYCRDNGTGGVPDLWFVFQNQRIQVPGTGRRTIRLQVTGNAVHPDSKVFQIGTRDRVPYMELVPS